MSGPEATGGQRQASTWSSSTAWRWCAGLGLVLVCLALRALPLAQQGGEAWEQPALLFTEPFSAYELRRVAVGQVQELIPTADRFLAHPRGAEPSHGPLLAGALSLLAPGAGAGRLRTVDAELLERRLSLAGPLLGLLLLVVGMASARRLTAPRAAPGGITRPGAWGRPRPGAGLTVGLFLALAPALIEHGQTGRLSVGLLAATWLVAQAGFLAGSLRSRERVDRLGAGLAAGVVGGLALSTTPLALVGVLAAWIALLRGARGLMGEEAEDANRAGLLYLLAMALVAQLPRWGGPWAAAGGAGADFADGVLLASLLGCAPFLLGRLASVATPRGRGLVWAGLVVGLLALGALGAELRRMVLEPLAGALDLWPGRASSADRPEPWPALLPLIVLPWLLLGPTALRRDPVCLHVGLLGTFTGCLALFSGGAGPLAFGALALVVGLAWAQPSAGAPPRWVRSPAGAVLAGGLLLGTLVPGVRSLVEGWEGTSERRAVVRALRGLREELPSPGPWTTARGPQAFGVLAEPGLALLATWHARLPAVSTPFSLRESGSPAARAVSSLARGGTETLDVTLAQSDARYLLVTGRSAGALGARLGAGAGQGLAQLLEDAGPGLDRAPRVAAGSAQALLVLERSPAPAPAAGGGAWLPRPPEAGGAGR
jgi:hypothetical protein